jgi:hypothetical protein
MERSTAAMPFRVGRQLTWPGLALIRKRPSNEGAAKEGRTAAVSQLPPDDRRPLSDKKLVCGRHVIHVLWSGLLLVHAQSESYRLGFPRFLRIESPRTSIRCAL